MKKQNASPEAEALPADETIACPECGSKMHKGALRTPGQLDSTVFVETRGREEEQHGSLNAWVCEACGYVRLNVKPSRRA